MIKYNNNYQILFVCDLHSKLYSNSKGFTRRACASCTNVCVVYMYVYMLVCACIVYVYEHV
jgi:hypothetical protein